VLDGESLELQAQQLQADYQRAHNEYIRIQPIKDTGAVSQLSVIEKRSAMEAAKARMEEAKLNLRRLTITAPDSGVIYERRARLGNLVNPNEPLFLIAQGNEIEANLHIPEAEISKIRIKQPVTLSVTGSTQEWQGTVRLISPRIDVNKRTAQVRVSIKNKETLIVGSFVQAEIFTHNKSGLALPATAIQKDSESHFVWVVNKENKPIRQTVTLIAQHDNMALVQGITPSMRIIAKAGAFIKAGDTVNPMEGK
jgi:HlyD family secretion protein